ncbi:MAG: ATP-binding protein [Lachnospiraceae bacterium]|nr:ATP-binding protein [Lachnospiraceae bacterium]
MGVSLNSKGQFVQFQKIYRDKYFVDKSQILSILNEALDTSGCYICITRPRRFGKTVMTNLITSYYAKGLDSKEIFEHLQIAGSPEYEKHLNQHNVISMYMSDIPEECKDYGDYIRFHSRRIKRELKSTFSQCQIELEDSLWEMLEMIYGETGERFIFIIDEWDSIFHNDMFTEQDCSSYLQFLKNLLKDRPYVELAYMTGILPIRKYSSGSELNMFDEFYFPTDSIYDTYFGFTQEEVKELCERNQRSGGNISYEQLSEWYNGYYTFHGEKLYNPRSVNKAFTQNRVKDYWTETGPGTEILYLVQKNVAAVRDEMVRMVSGEQIYFSEDDFVTDVEPLESREEIFSAMVIYGFLSYYKSCLSIPNKEIMKKFQRVLRDKSMGYIAELVKNSEAMLQATLAGDTDKMEQILEYVHDTEIPILQYNDENSLSCIVNLIYLNARDRYRIEREEKSGKGFVDFIFYPYDKSRPGIILELKKNKSPEAAIEQIKEKNYAARFQVLQDGSREYTGKVLAVGMNYDSQKKIHSCRVEELAAGARQASI